MPDITFSHPQVRAGAPLTINTGANLIKWSYALNTQTWPTYGGEVVQILSVMINDVTIQGNLRSYSELEDIYSYFIEYVQIATQGVVVDPKVGTTSYNQTPMMMQYPERQWSMKIIPKSLPGFRKHRDVVSPEWMIQAHMVDDSDDVQELKNLVLDGVQVQGESFELTADIGYNASNAFSDPFPDNKGQLQFDPKTADVWQKYGDYYNELIPSWLQGNFDSITNQFGAAPAFLKGGATTDGSTGSQTTQGGGK